MGGQTTVGPHRDDLILEINGRPASRFASEGQQRTIALAMKLGQLAQLREATGKRPILLVDDIFGELDQGRRRLLFEAFPPDGQKWLTTTSTSWLPDQGDLGARIYRVVAGTVEPADER